MHPPTKKETDKKKCMGFILIQFETESFIVRNKRGKQVSLI